MGSAFIRQERQTKTVDLTLYGQTLETTPIAKFLDVTQNWQGTGRAVLGWKFVIRSAENPSLKPMIQEEQQNPPRVLSRTPLSVL
jgi:hypothetical protein